MEPPDGRMDPDSLESATNQRVAVTVLQARRFVRREARRLMPGAVLLMAAEVVVWVKRWSELTQPTQYVFGAGIVAAVVSATLFGLAWAARQPEQGREAIRAYRRASIALVLGVLLLALGLAGDYFVAVDKATGSLGLGAAAGAAILLATYGVWSGATP